MRRVARAVVGVVLCAVATLGLAGPAGAATPPDKPVVNVARLTVQDGGGVTPDSWRTYVTYPVSGFNFTPGGDVYVTFQDLTAGTSALTGEWVKAGTGPCGLECNNYGKIAYSRTISYAYRSVCNHWMRVLAWDAVKSPQTGYGWSYRDLQVTCSA